MMTIGGAHLLLSLFGNLHRAPESLWAALVTKPTTNPAISGENLSEPKVDEYARAEIENTSGSWVILGTTLSNTATVTFPTADTQWGDIWGWALCSAQVGGDVLVLETLPSPSLVTVGDTVTIPPGGISLELNVDQWSL